MLTFLFILCYISVNHFCCKFYLDLLILFDVLQQTNYYFAAFLLFLFFLAATCIPSLILFDISLILVECFVHLLLPRNEFFFDFFLA
jgi:hypothetical protein